MNKKYLLRLESNWREVLFIFIDKSRLVEGEYEFYVDCYSYRNGHTGFKAELEIFGTLFKFEFKKCNT